MRVSPRTPRRCVLAMYDGGLLRASRRVEVDLDLVSRRQRLDAHTKAKYKMRRKCEYLRWARKANTDKSQTAVRHAGVEYAESKDQVNIRYYILHMNAYLSPKTKRSR